MHKIKLRYEIIICVQFIYIPKRLYEKAQFVPRMY